MLPNIQQNQLVNYYEDEIRSRQPRKALEGYSGNGYWWYGYPAYIGGISDFAAAAGDPGSNLEAVAETSMSKVGGGILGADIPPYGGTAAH
jgi:hypothetical protein